MDSMRATATTNTRPVLAMYMTAGPTIMRTAFRSFVARDMRSPVRVAWKYASGSFCRWATKALRRSYSMAREAPTRMRRMRNRNTPPAIARPSRVAACPASSARVTPAVRSSTA